MGRFDSVLFDWTQLRCSVDFASKQAEVVGKPMSFYIVVMKDETAEKESSGCDTFFWQAISCLSILIHKV